MGARYGAIISAGRLLRLLQVSHHRNDASTFTYIMWNGAFPCGANGFYRPRACAVQALFHYLSTPLSLLRVLSLLFNMNSIGLYKYLRNQIGNDAKKDICCHGSLWTFLYELQLTSSPLRRPNELSEVQHNGSMTKIFNSRILVSCIAQDGALLPELFRPTEKSFLDREHATIIPKFQLSNLFIANQTTSST